MTSTIRWTWKSISGTFLAGLFAVLPLVVTAAIVFWVAGFIDRTVGPDPLNVQHV